MTIDVEVISREKIKPFTPTPDHLRHYQFSFLDQLSPSFYMSFIYFYNINLDDKFSNNDISSNLKTSFSKVLTSYYPLAGRIENNYVDCNDGGALFLEAQVGCRLSEFIQEPLASELKKFLPDDKKQDGANNFVFAIQINFFNCGSVAIGALMSHKIGDASSMIRFIINWTGFARGETANFYPQFVSATLFPPKDIGGLTSTVSLPPEENIVLKRFVFGGSSMNALKEKYTERTSSDNEIHPTRVEALSSFIWSRFTASTQKKIGLEKPCMLVHPLNLRTKMDQSLPEDQSFGNISGPSVTVFSQIFNGEECCGLVSKFRDAKSKLNKDYVKKLQEGIFEDFGLLELMHDERFNQDEMVKFYITSLCRFPLYETNFGWGRPVWVALGGLPHSNLAILIDTKRGDGIEAWIHLKEEDMAKFETDQELLSFLSSTSSS